MRTISKVVKHDSVCDVYRYLKKNIFACGELDMKTLMDLEMLMPYKRLAKILDNREKYFVLYPEKREEFKKKVIEDLESNKPKDE